MGVRERAIIRCVQPADEPWLALTFDDGPGDVTPAILDLLDEHGASATFFVVGRAISGRERVLRRQLAGGHELGNHLFSHPHAGRLSDDELRSEMSRCTEAIEVATATRPRLVRPPYGEDAERVARIAREQELGPVVLWSIDPRDWEGPPPGVIAGRVLGEAAPGAIVDLHDGFGSSPGARQATAAALALILPELAERQFRLVTVSELLQG